MEQRQRWARSGKLMAVAGQPMGGVGSRREDEEGGRGCRPQ